jgi:hypothetical protein
MTGLFQNMRIFRLAAALFLIAITVAISACGQDVDYRSLLDDLTNGSDEKQYNAAIEFGKQKETRAVEALTFIIKDDDPFVREAVALSLGEIGDPAAVPALSDAATGDSSSTVRENAVYSLGQIGDPAAIGTLAEILRDEGPPNIEAFEVGGDAPNEALLAAFSLRRIGAPAITPLTEVAVSTDLAVRRVAVATLGEIGLDTGDYSATPFLLAMLSDTNALVRETAAHALIITGDPSSLDGLAAALGTVGTERMAGFFLNSGQDQLVSAATGWISANGLDLDAIRCSVNGKAKWGDFDADAGVADCAETA